MMFPNQFVACSHGWVPLQSWVAVLLLVQGASCALSKGSQPGHV